MNSIRESMVEIGVKWSSKLAPWDKDSINDVLDAAVEWQEGRLPIFEFAKLGDIRTPAYTRYMAMLCSCGDERQLALRAAIEELLKAQGYVFTNHGMFTPNELGDAGMSVRWRHDQ